MKSANLAMSDHLFRAAWRSTVDIAGSRSSSPHARDSDWSSSSGAGGNMRARKTRKEGRCGILMLIRHCETTASSA